MNRTKRIECLMEFWQAQLRLMDWDIEVLERRHYDMGEAEGKCHWSLNRRIATINILAECDQPDPGVFVSPTLEETLVHELVHISLAAVDDSARIGLGPSLLDAAFEQHVDSISRALVKLRRTHKAFHWENEGSGS